MTAGEFLNFWPYYSYSPFYKHSDTFDYYKFGPMYDCYYRIPYRLPPTQSYFSWRYENSYYPY
ncbi:unnamed protein product [Meloidogyne enterolobii]|uniref:Uncharacterized protein n=1 Tax=Meloidogyne enterolobii TaxID=390850 RepID=A0ACB0ZUE4_MELEN